MRKIKIDELREVISESSQESSIYIGCDSQRYWSKKEEKMIINFVRVVIIHVNSSEGCMVFGDKTKEIDYTNSIRYRMMQEVFKVTELGMELIDVIGDRHFEIHLDISTDPKNKSNAAMKEAMGYVRGVLGITPKVKPDSFGASCAADRWTK